MNVDPQYCSDPGSAAKRLCSIRVQSASTLGKRVDDIGNTPAVRINAGLPATRPASLPLPTTVSNSGANARAFRDAWCLPPVPPRQTAPPRAPATQEDDASDWGSDFDDLDADTGRASGYTEEEMAFFDARHRMEDLQIRRFNRQFRPPPPPRRTRPAT